MANSALSFTPPYSRGVSILISNVIPFQLLQSLTDEQGRYSFLLCRLAGVLCIIANVYVPPSSTPNSLNKLAQFMAPHSNVPSWVLGDFNTVINKGLDRFSSRSSGGSSKALGTDGLPIEMYKRYSETLLPTLLWTLNEALKSGQLPMTTGEAVVVVLPKPGKDPLQPDSYRPISLLTSDVKILARVLATRLEKVLYRDWCIPTNPALSLHNLQH